jgi:hypothetical protein
MKASGLGRLLSLSTLWPMKAGVNRTPPDIPSGNLSARHSPHREALAVGKVVREFLLPLSTQNRNLKPSPCVYGAPTSIGDHARLYEVFYPMLVAM